MSTDLDDRIRDAVTQLAGAVGDPAPFPSAIEADANRATRRRVPSPVVVVAAALAVVLAVGVPVVLLSLRGGPSEPAPDASFPIAEYRVGYLLDSTDAAAGAARRTFGGYVLVPVAFRVSDSATTTLDAIDEAISSILNATSAPTVLSKSGIMEVRGVSFNPELLWPRGLRLQRLMLSDGVLTVHFSAEWSELATSGPSIQEAAVVFTATQFDAVDAVEFVAGDEPVAGGARTRADYYDILPDVLVETPIVNGPVSSPIVISGVSNLTDEPLRYRVETYEGDIVARGSIDAECAPSCDGDFSVSVPYELEHQLPGTVSVFTEGPVGERTFIIRYPVLLQPNPGPPRSFPEDVTSGISTPFDLGDVDWIASGVDRSPRGISSRTMRHGSKSAAWDGGDGVVYVSDEQDLRWITPEFHRAIRALEPLGDGTYPALLDVVVVDGRPLAALGSDGTGPTWVDLTTGDVVGGPNERFVLGDQYEITADGLTAYIEQPDWEGLPRDGGAGGPLPPFPLATLVVQEEGGSDVLHTTIGTYRLPQAQIHDFDGRRLVYSLSPFEPPGNRFVVLDLACPTCTQVIYEHRFVWYDLVGTAPSEPAPAGCSTSGLNIELADEPGLPTAVADTRQALFDAATSCNFPRLLDLVNVGTTQFASSVGDDVVDWIEAERLFANGEQGGVPVLAQLVEYLNQPFDRSSGVIENYVWSVNGDGANGVVIDPEGEWLGFTAGG